MIAGNNKNAIKMIEALSRFFRISLSKGQDLVTLSDELEHVRNYLIIQGMRYQNKILFDINVDESLINYMTLKIILQPLVENSIYHGIKNKDEEGHINISAEIVENDLIISVADDGVGMDEETCNDILKETFVQKHPSGSGIGVRNVNSRIKLYFGDEYGLSFKSELGVGTTVYIKLPLILE
jgi:two-component system sensor histidine kinase YesM